MSSRRRTAGLLAVTLALGGCSPSAGGRSEGTAVDDVAPDSLAFADSTVPEPVRLALVRPHGATSEVEGAEVPLDAWDPAMVTMGDQGQVIVADLLYDGLTEASADGRLRPGLATSWVAEDGFRRWTFELDGGRVEAATVVSSFGRLQEVPPDSAVVALLAHVEAIEPVGENGVVFTLREPDAGFAWLLSGVAFSVFGVEPTGRYEIEESGSDGMTLVAEAGRAIEVRWAPDQAATYEWLQAGEVDAAVVVDASLLRDATRTFGMRATPRSIVRFYALNLGSPRLSDPRTREAVLAAADRPGMMAQLSTAGFTAGGVAAPVIAGAGSEPCGACVFDPAKARGLLAEVGAAPTLTIGHVGADQLGPANVLAGNLRAVGFGAVVQDVAARDLAAAIEAEMVDVFSFGWAAPAGSLDAVVAPLFWSRSSLNVTQLTSAEVDDLILRAASTAEDELRWDLLRQAEQAALSQWTVIPVVVAHNGLVQRRSDSPLLVRADGSIDASGLG